MKWKILAQSFCSLNEDIIDVLSACKHHDKSVSVAARNVTETKNADFCTVVSPQF